MRSMPNMLIAAPGDPLEVRACLRYLVNHPQPSYLRLGKAGEPSFHSAVPDVAPGKWLTVKSGAENPRATILTTGATLELGMAMASGVLEKELAVHSLPLWGMASKTSQSAFADRFEEILTLEDHLSDAGFGSWMMEAFSGSSNLGKLRVQALSPEVCGTVGSQATLNRLGGLVSNLITR